MITADNGKIVSGYAGTTSVIQYSIIGSYPYSDVRTIAQGTLTDAEATLYTAPVSLSVLIKSIFLVNTSASAVTGIILKLNAYRVSPSLSIPAYGSAVYEDGTGWRVMDANGAQVSTGVSIGGTVVKTTPLAISTAGSGTTPSAYDHTHQSPGGIAAITAQFTKDNSDNEFQITSATIPASYLIAGSTLRVHIKGTYDTSSNAGTTTFRVRVGPTTLTGNVACTINPTVGNSLVDTSFNLIAMVTVRTVGTSGTLVGGGEIYGNIGASNAFLYRGNMGHSTVAVNTTVANIIELTHQFGTASASNIIKVEIAEIEVVKM